MEVIPREEVIKLHLELRSNKKALKDLMSKRGLTEETIIRYEIGYDKKSGRYTIPIKSSIGEFVNIRKYKMGASESKVISHGEGYGEARLYPFQVLHEDPKSIVLCEGELDALVLNQNGIPAITGTCGVSTWKEEWTNQLANRKVAIVYDCDDAGRKSAKKLSNNLIDLCKEVRVIDLELDDKEDVTDWFVKYKKDADGLVKLIKDTEPLDAYKLIDLANGMDGKYYDKRIKFSGVVVGKDLSPYLLPKVVKASCYGEDKKFCSVCPLMGKKFMKRVFDYDQDKINIIRMVNANDTQVLGIVKTVMGLPKSDKCREMRIEIEEKMNVEDIRLIPEIDFERMEEEYVIRKCFYFGLGIQTNQSYVCRGTTVSDPNNQMGVHLVKEVKGSKDNLSRFVFTDEIKNDLKKFEPKDQKDEASCWEKINEIHEDMTYNVTEMYQRESIIHGTELVYHSALYFKFQGKTIPKGWVEMTCIGDTQCGKTETIKSLVKHYRAGEFISSGENTTLAGILGGVQQTHQGRWTVTWGKLPINDKGACIVDEADELIKDNVIGRLSGVRSTGIAEIVKIQPQRTMARTRIIFIANPVNGDLSHYNYGVEAVVELFQKQQDISRIDVLVCASRKDVPTSVINRAKDKKVKHVYTSDICHYRVMWAWNRRQEHIHFLDGAEKYILETAEELGKIYSSKLPLVVGGQIRLKLARLAVAQAICLHSTDDEGENVLVYPSHVKVVRSFMLKSYNNPVCGYREFSDKRKRENNLREEHGLDEVIKYEDEVNLMLDMNHLRQQDFMNILELDRDGARRAISIMWKARAIKPTHTFYVKTPAFIEWLKEKRQSFNTRF